MRVDERRILVLMVVAVFAMVLAPARAAWRWLRANVFWLPYVARRGPSEWSIGIYSGADPLRLSPHPEAAGPALRAADVTDVPAEFVADPFMVRQGNRYWMFFEVMSFRTRRGEIGLAASDDGLHWTYRQIVLREPFHLSYPCVFSWNDQYYMVPESRRSGQVRLYRADDFPLRWSFAGALLAGDHGDPTPFCHEGRWWMFASAANDVLNLFCAERLEGPWSIHPRSPVVCGSREIARPGGRVTTFGGRIVRFAQDGRRAYGSQVHAVEILTLTPTEYCERPLEGNPVLRPGGAAWNADGMHHVDPHELGEGRWLACVDGYRKTAPRLTVGW